MAELLGTHSYQLDPKGRLSLPARFREAFADGAWLTIGQDGCLFVFPRAEWERRADEVAASPLSDAAGRAYARLFFGSSDEAQARRPGSPDDPGPAARRAWGSARTSSCWACATGWRSGTARPTSATRRPSPARTRRGTLEHRGGQERWHRDGKLGTEVRQSLSLIGMIALTLVASIAFGLLVGHVG